MGLFRRKKAEPEPEPTPEPAPAPTLPEPPGQDERGLRSVEDQRAWTLSMIHELPPFGMQLLDVVGLGLCEEIRSDVNLPGFDNTAMDGYAVRAQDIAAATADAPIVLEVVGLSLIHI